MSWLANPYEGFAGCSEATALRGELGLTTWCSKPGITAHWPNGSEEEPAVITCYLRYIIDPYKVAEFERYARMVIPLAAKYGGTQHGYFLPDEGPNNIAVNLFSVLFPVTRGL